MDSNNEVIELRARPPRIPPTLSSLGLSLLMLLMTCGVAWYLHGEARDELGNEVRRGLLRLAALTAERIDGDAHQRLLDGTDKNDPRFARANRVMVQAVAVDPEIVYAYSVIERGGQLYFVLDSEPPAGPDELAVLQPYEKDVPTALRTALAEGKAQISDPYSDEWGNWITAYAPFHNDRGEVIGVVGLDLTLAEYQRRLVPMQSATYAIYVAGTVASLLIGFGLWWSYRRSGALNQLGRQLSNVNALLNVSKVLGSNVGVDNLLRVIVAKTTAVMRAERTSLFLYDKDRKNLVGRITEGAAAGTEFVVPDDRGIVGRVARSGQIANVDDPAADPDFDGAFDRQSGFKTRRLLTVPIFDPKKTVIGVLQVLNTRDNRPFDRNDEVMLSALAAQAQIAIERERANQRAAESRKLQDALKFAQSIQLGMLPSRFEDLHEAGIDLYARLIPARMVGGDFYDFILTDKRKIGLVMADVSGKGVPAALLMAKSMTLIRAHLEASGDPAETLAKANQELSVDNDQAMFVTVFAAVYDLSNGTLIYSNAGHNHPVIVRDSNTLEIDGAKSVPLGASERAEFANAQLKLKERDVLFLYTDGVNEAMDPDNNEYGEQRMFELLVGYSNEDMTTLVNSCVDSVNSFARGADQSDDITALAMRVPPIG